MKEEPICVKDENGNEFWILESKSNLNIGSLFYFYHRDDGPAIKRKSGSESWYKNGKYHRDNGPAITYFRSSGEIGYREWYQNGKPHRLDGPAFDSGWLKIYSIME